MRACRRIFAVFDANGDGLLDFEELMRVSTLKPSTSVRTRREHILYICKCYTYAYLYMQ